MTFSCSHLGTYFPSIQTRCSLNGLKSQYLHAQVHVSLLCPSVEQLAQVTSWCLHLLASFSRRYSTRFCFCRIWTRACSPLCELQRKIFCHGVIVLLQPMLREWKKASVYAHEFSDVANHSVYVGCHLFLMVELKIFQSPITAELFIFINDFCWYIFRTYRKQSVYFEKFVP